MNVTLRSHGRHRRPDRHTGPAVLAALGVVAAGFTTVHFVQQTPGEATATTWVATPSIARPSIVDPGRAKPGAAKPGAAKANVAKAGTPTGTISGTEVTLRLHTPGSDRPSFALPPVPAHTLTSGTRVDLICYLRGQPVTGPDALTADPLWDETTGPGLHVKEGQVPVVPNAFVHTDHPVDQLIPPCDPTDSATSQTHSQTHGQFDGQYSNQSGAQAVVAYARAQLGKPYLFGATGPDAFDCSGLTLSAWAAVGVHLPRIASDQANAGTRTTRDALVPGDLIVSNNYGHVQLYIGDGNVIEAAHPGTTVDIGQLPPSAQVDAYVHLTPPTHG